jgi:hypothetical protein
MKITPSSANSRCNSVSRARRPPNRAATVGRSRSDPMPGRGGAMVVISTPLTSQCTFARLVQHYAACRVLARGDSWDNRARCPHVPAVAGPRSTRVPWGAISRFTGALNETGRRWDEREACLIAAVKESQSEGPGGGRVTEQDHTDAPGAAHTLPSPRSRAFHARRRRRRQGKTIEMGAQKAVRRPTNEVNRCVSHASPLRCFRAEAAGHHANPGRRSITQSTTSIARRNAGSR